jgi:glycosyltransferase involved in cell wall biosynthesis
LSQPQSQDTSLLLELPVPFGLLDGVLHVEAQAANGLRLWLENFERVTVCAPLLPPKEGDPTWEWKRPPTSAAGALELVPLPNGYRLDRFIRHLPAVRMNFKHLIARHRYLLFSNLGGIGAWGTVAADEARRAGRPYAVWLDYVLHEMPQRELTGRALHLRRIKQRLEQRWLKSGSLRAIRHASLGLFHGRTVYEGYEPYSRRPALVHDVHLGPEMQIAPDALRCKATPRSGSVELLYVGRVHPMKGPLDWIDAVEQTLRSLAGRVTLQATWIGDGPLLATCRQEVQRRGLSEVVSFPGAELDRARVIARMRAADVFLFCHLTPESPRCLIEALMSGTPLVGYQSAYAQDLTEAHGGGIFSPMGNASALAQTLSSLLTELPVRTRLAELTLQAAASGAEFSDEVVFAHRSQLLKQYL